MNDPEDVLGHVPPGADLIVPLGAGEPVRLLDTLEAHADRLQDVRVHRMDPQRERAYIRGEFGDRLRHVDYFLGPGSRAAYWAGHCDLVPVHFSEAAMLMRATTKCTLALAAVSPPDRQGYVSLGTNADYTASFIGDIPFFVEVNPHMPYTSGENLIHLGDVAGWCDSDTPLPEPRRIQPDQRDRAIAGYIAERVPDGACLQIGIGHVPSALPDALAGHRDLGVHTEVLSDGIMDLVEKGAVTGARKRHFRNKHVATFCLGSRRLYDWLDHNGAVSMMPAAWVNSPRTVAREPGMVSVNATSEVDLLGQVASETIAGRYWSGSGGQSDFAHGAMYSEGGQGFLVLHATTRDGTSRINLRLTPGSVVTTLKNTVDNVVTEYGVAELRGRTVAERAASLVRIAHPAHRERLHHEAHHAGLLR
ncbi:acetyl-CoA hydrolase/transferase family protein [Sphaerisporangium album]|uniref:Acetyl-CoA hydrolase/transferase family protein n=1 Tax=Sphaerisporangium album TaxID=509200 RepID=A0A367F769_9ACTN|nr:acetyl-CoA hydrolase/transferase C-terminal domain-containing protein [Sphaerisporangium album]RCG25400.1 acetyl-CoA hydrolase/transferase family protein [Sphaerisporangium album]